MGLKLQGSTKHFKSFKLEDLEPFTLMGDSEGNWKWIIHNKEGDKMVDRVWAYESRPVTQERADEIKQFRTLFTQLAQSIDVGVAKDPRLAATAQTHLEIAAMLVTKSISHYKE